MTLAWFPTWQRAPRGESVAPDEHPGAVQTVLLGAQHVLSMTGSTVLGPLLMGFDPNVAILGAGLGTLLFFVVTRGLVPSFLGSSFSFIALVIGLTGYVGHGSNPDIPLACGGIFAAGLAYALIGLTLGLTGTGWIERLMPPTVTGAIGMAIGLNLAPVATRGLGHGGTETGCGLFGLLCMVLLARYGRPTLRRMSILLSLFAASAVYVVVANVLHLTAKPVDFTAVRQAPLLGTPHFVAPRFTLHAATLLAPVALVLVAENLGHLKAISAMTGRPVDRMMDRAFLGDGLATMLAACLGGTGVTTYVENIGVMALSRVYSTLTFAAAGALALLLGFSPFFGALLRTVPEAVLAGLSVGLLGLIAATMVRVWVDNRVDFTAPATLLPVGVALIAGAGDITFVFGPVTLGGISVATIAAIGLNQMLAPRSATRETADAGQ